MPASAATVAMRVGQRVVLILLRVHHRVQDQTDDGDDQEYVLGQQHDRLVLHQQPEHTEYRQAQEINRPLDVDRAQEAFLELLGVGRLGVTHQVFLSVHERKQADDHADTGSTEAVLPAKRLTEPAAQQRRRERANVDAHVENGETRIAPRIVLEYSLPTMVEIFGFR